MTVAAMEYSTAAWRMIGLMFDSVSKEMRYRSDLPLQLLARMTSIGKSNICYHYY